MGTGHHVIRSSSYHDVVHRAAPRNACGVVPAAADRVVIPFVYGVQVAPRYHVVVGKGGDRVRVAAADHVVGGRCVDPVVLSAADNVQAGIVHDHVAVAATDAVVVGPVADIVFLSAADGVVVGGVVDAIPVAAADKVIVGCGIDHVGGSSQHGAVVGCCGDQRVGSGPKRIVGCSRLYYGRIDNAAEARAPDPVLNGRHQVLHFRSFLLVPLPRFRLRFDNHACGHVVVADVDILSAAQFKDRPFCADLLSVYADPRHVGHLHFLRRHGTVGQFAGGDRPVGQVQRIRRGSQRRKRGHSLRSVNGGSHPQRAVHLLRLREGGIVAAEIQVEDAVDHVCAVRALPDCLCSGFVGKQRYGNVVVTVRKGRSVVGGQKPLIADGTGYVKRAGLLGNAGNRCGRQHEC